MALRCQGRRIRLKLIRMTNDRLTLVPGDKIPATREHLQPATRVQFGLGALVQRSDTPSLRVAGFEDEDDDENEAPGEASPICHLSFVICDLS
jgi:hypothetical protein